MKGPTQIFIAIYRFFERHKALMYALMIGSALVFGFFTARVHFEENIAKLLPQTDKADESGIAFSNIKVKDNFFIQVTGREGAEVSAETLAAAQDRFFEELHALDTLPGKRHHLIESSLWKLTEDDMMNALFWAMNYAPTLIPPEAYPFIEEKVRGMIETEDFNLSELDLLDYGMVDGHLFTRDSTVAIGFVAANFNTTDSQYCTFMVREIRKAAERMQADYPDVRVLTHGAGVSSENNATRIKKDIVITVGLSLLVILIVLLVCLRWRGTLLHILMPIGYGTLFSLTCIYLIQGQMSFMAIGLGALVLGVALSYCLHFITHHKYVSDPEQVIREQARPVCLGCLTTIGAFSGLLLTTSSLLRDFGLFASFALIGTTFFVLIFLPHFFNEKNAQRNEKAFELIDRINSYRFDRNKWIVGAVVAVCLLGIVFSGKVKFDSDLNHIGYLDHNYLESETLFNHKVYGGMVSEYYAGRGYDLETAMLNSRRIADTLDVLGIRHSITHMLFVPEDEQLERIEFWHNWWTPERLELVPEEYRYLADADFEPGSPIGSGALPDHLMSNFYEQCEDQYLVFVNATLPREELHRIDDAVNEIDGAVVMQPFYYTDYMVEIVHQDFSTVLIISAVFVLLVLLISYGSIFTALLAFLPMFVSWYVVEGLMALLGVEFNLINIVVSSFIFGVGVDYSIFVMDGLIANAKSRSDALLLRHKAAIVFSVFSLIVVTCSLLFARHPSIWSIGVCTVIGMVTTVMLTYTIQPLLFHLMTRNEWLRGQMLKGTRSKKKS